MVFLYGIQGRLRQLFLLNNTLRIATRSDATRFGMPSVAHRRVKLLLMVANSIAAIEIRLSVNEPLMWKLDGFCKPCSLAGTWGTNWLLPFFRNQDLTIHASLVHYINSPARVTLRLDTDYPFTHTIKIRELPNHTRILLSFIDFSIYRVTKTINHVNRAPTQKF